MLSRTKVGVLISGRGSNLQALIDAAQDRAFPAEIVLVISNVPGAVGLARAEQAGIAQAVVNHRDFHDRESFEAALIETLEKSGVELVCHAGFMRIVTSRYVDHWLNRLINIHPSLLPAFPGLDTHARALAAGVRLAGCTVHFVREAVDEGPIIGQAAVPVLAGDTEETLAARVLAAEHRLYPRCLELVAAGKVRVTDDRLEILGAEPPGEASLINPAT